jgi:hypothetical protein
MRMPGYLGVVLMTLALIQSLEAAGQQASEGGLRDPNPQERQILMHYREVIGKVLDQFRSDDWEEKVDYARKRCGVGKIPTPQVFWHAIMRKSGMIGTRRH